MTGEPVTWSRAWHEAHLGPRGFYRHHSPERHFATEAQAELMAQALAVFIDQVVREVHDTWTRTDEPRTAEPCTGEDSFDIIDVGAGSGELLQSLVQRLGTDERFRFTAIDVRPRPTALSPRIEWITGEAPGVLGDLRPHGVTGVIIAHEWLDDIPVDVVARDEAGALRHVLVEPHSGVEVPGDEIASGSDAQQWLNTWWGPVVDRAEIGIYRDVAWRDLCASLRCGAAVAIDYGHMRTQRERFAAGSIIGYRDGATHWPIPDGSMNITAHVTWESLAAATDPHGCVRNQSEAITELLPPAPHPDRALAETDPARYTDQLRQHNDRARMLDRSAGFSWLTYTPPRPRV